MTSSALTEQYRTIMIAASCIYHLLTLRSAFTVAVVGSAVVVRFQVRQHRKEQEARGSQPSEKLSWEERVAIEEQKSSRSSALSQAYSSDNGICQL